MNDNKSPLSVYRAAIKRQDKFIQQQKNEISSLITTIESQQLEIDFALKTLNEIYDLRPTAEENYLHVLNECQHRAKHAANEIEWRRRNAK